MGVAPNSDIWRGNMRRITLLLPALLVVFLSGQARAEASEVEAAQPPHVLPLKEEIESRDIREAGKEDKAAARKRKRKNEKEGANEKTKLSRRKKKADSKKKGKKTQNKRKRKKKNRKDKKGDKKD